MVQFCESNLGIWKCAFFSFFFGRPILFLFFFPLREEHFWISVSYTSSSSEGLLFPCFAICMLSMGEPVRAILIVVSLRLFACPVNLQTDSLPCLVRYFSCIDFLRVNEFAWIIQQGGWDVRWAKQTAWTEASKAGGCDGGEGWRG